MEEKTNQSSLPEKVRTIAVCNAIMLCFCFFLFLEKMLDVDLELILINPAFDPIIISVIFIIPLLCYLALHRSTKSNSKFMISQYFVLASIQVISFSGLVTYYLIEISLPYSELIVSHEAILYLTTCMVWNVFKMYSIFVVALFYREASQKHQFKIGVKKPTQGLLKQQNKISFSDLSVYVSKASSTGLFPTNSSELSEPNEALLDTGISV